APPGPLADDADAVGPVSHRRRRHPAQRVVPTRIGMDEYRAVFLQHQQPGGLRQERGQPAGVEDFAAGDDQAHDGDANGWFGGWPFLTGPQPSVVALSSTRARVTMEGGDRLPPTS